MAADYDSSVADCILGTAADWDLHPWDINNGDCCDFANVVSVHLTSMGVEHEVRFTSDESPLPGHDWIFSGGLHYDAETPYGVPTENMLPIFVRALYQQRNNIEPPSSLATS